MSSTQSFTNEFITQVLASLPIDKSLELRKVSKEWKELIECELFWMHIDEILNSFEAEWSLGVANAKNDLTKLANYLASQPEDEQNNQIIMHLEGYDIDSAGYEKDYLKYHIAPDGPVAEADVRFSDHFNFVFSDLESWEDKLKAIYKFKKSALDRMRFFQKRPEIVLLINHPFVNEIGKLGEVENLTNLLCKIVGFFESGISPYNFSSIPNKIDVNSESTLNLVNSDGEFYTIPKGVAILSDQLYKLIKDLDENSPLPIPIGEKGVLGKVVTYLTYHYENPLPTSSFCESFNKIQDWDKNFLAQNESNLAEIVEVAEFLQIKGLLSLISWSVGDKIKNLSTEEIRTMFSLLANHTEEDLAKIENEDKTFIIKEEE